MSYIIGRSYDSIELGEFNSYRLFKAKRCGFKYTGFNMGAGENAVLGLLLEILSAGRGALIVVDEIELGLHVQAQVRLINKLKELCNEYNCQIICSTHSKYVLNSLPPEARIFIKRSDSTTEIIPNISSEYAFGMLSGYNSEELLVLVEDDVATSFLINIFPKNIRERVKILFVGSHNVVLKHMAVHLRENNRNFIAFLDGDQKTRKLSAIGKVKVELGQQVSQWEDIDQFMEARLNFLPGTSWPEKTLVEFALCADNLEGLRKAWNTSIEDVKIVLEQALTAGKHREFYEIAQKTFLTCDQVRTDLIRFYIDNNQQEIQPIIDTVERILSVPVATSEG